MIWRWSLIVLYGVLGGIVAFLVDPLLSFLSTTPTAPLSQLPLWIVWASALIVVAAGTSFLYEMNRCRARQLLELRYPSWVWAVVLGSGLAIWLQSMTGKAVIPLAPGRLLPLFAPIVGGVAMGLAVGWWKDREGSGFPRHAASAKAEQLREVFDDPVRLDKWVSEPEGPVDVLHRDRFGHTPIARRIVQHLNDPESTRSIGLVGPFGSGKTSILRGVESLLRAQDGSNGRVLVVWARSWGTDSGMSAAELILRSALAEVGKRVDTLGLADIPATYRAALERSGSSVLGTLAALVSGTPEPESTLARLDRALEAARLRLIIFVDDLDRNNLGQGRFNEVQALLDRLKQRTRQISFVVAIGEESRQHIDFAKICDRYEVLPDLPASDAERAIRSFVVGRLKEHPSDVVWYRDRDAKFMGVDNVTEIDIPSALLTLVSTPRQLRTTLRRVHLSWRQLHGEIDLLELLVINALRTSVPAAFEFLMTNIRELRGHLVRDEKKHVDWLKARWDGAAIPASVRSVAEDALDYLFPGRLKDMRVFPLPDTPQSVRHGQWAGPDLVIGDPADYWQRMLTEEVEGLRDQDVAQKILIWKSDRDIAKMVGELVSADTFAVRFERLVGASPSSSQPLYLSLEDLYALAEGLHTHMLTTGGTAAAIRDSGTPDGFFGIWRLLLKRNRSGKHLAWVQSQIDNSLDTSLRFALDIEHWWTTANETPELQREARRYLVKQVQVRTENRAWLARTLNGADPWVLHNLIRHTYDDPVFVPEDFNWFVPALIALIVRGQEYAPHAAALLSASTDGIVADSSGRRKHVQKHVLDRAFLEQFVPDSGQQIQLLQLLEENQTSSPMPESGRLLLAEMREDIIGYLEGIRAAIPANVRTVGEEE